MHFATFTVKIINVIGQAVTFQHRNKIKQLVNNVNDTFTSGNLFNDHNSLVNKKGKNSRGEHFNKYQH